MVDETTVERRTDAIRLVPDLASVTAALGQAFLAERERWALWLPVAFALGIALYFAWPTEPWAWLGLTVTCPIAILCFWALRTAHRFGPAILLILLPVGLAAAGFAMAELQTWRAMAPTLERRIGPVTASGIVADVETLAEGIRVTLDHAAIEHLAPERTPERVRFRLKHGDAVPEPGDHLTGSVILMPPPAPSSPGGFDFQREAFFARLGGVGFAVGPVTLTPATGGSAKAMLRTLRHAMSNRIHQALPGPEGAIAAAIITGERGAISPEIAQDFRDSGLTHLLVIAGLHMSLVTGAAFFAVRAALALIPRLALTRPIKKWAAAAALLIAALYLGISGAAVPTQRAFIMCALALGAILIDRQPLSMRALAWAAFAVLLIAPAAILGVSFQMSFAAVLGLIAFYETWGGQLGGLRRDAGPIGHGMLHLLGIALTTIVATLGTAAFAIYHFNRFALFSVPANLIAVPLAAIWVMPWALIACLLMPLGLEAVGLVPMGWGLRLIEAVAHGTARLPGAAVDLPAMPAWGLWLIAGGGLWLTIWRTGWRRWGLVAMLAGIASLSMAPPPDILLAADGGLFAVRTGPGYVLPPSRTDRVIAEEWLRRAGGLPAAPLPTAPRPGMDRLSCDDDACALDHAGRHIAIVREIRALDEECRTADLVLSLVRAPRSCRTRTHLIDLSDLRRDGATAIWLDEPLRIERANPLRGDRPWVPRWTGAAPANSGASARPDAPGP